MCPAPHPSDEDLSLGTPAPDGAEVFILCRGAQRQQKLQAMHARFEKRIAGVPRPTEWVPRRSSSVGRIDEELRKIEAACEKRKQNAPAIAQRVGRLRGSNTRAAGLFQVQVEADSNGSARLRWSRSEQWRDWARLSEGCYCCAATS